MRSPLKDIKILRGLFKDEIFSLFAEYSEGNSDKFAEFTYAFYNRKNYDAEKLNFMAYVENLIMSDDNIVSRMLAAENKPDRVLINALEMDIDIILTSVEAADPHGWYSCEHEKFKTAQEAYNLMTAVYPNCGYGIFMRSYAFAYDNGQLVPVAELLSKSQPSLDKLKDYQLEKRLIENNLINFLKGYPCSNMLLYGDRGTGKSSTVHAMVSRYFKDGLRLVELDRQNLKEIPTVRKLVENSPLKFIIFIDDLSLSDGDENLSSLKACLEGTAAVSENTIVVATSNRRHIIKENFSDRQNAVHATDVLEEQLSLSDRFGLTVMFSSTGKSEYLSIVKQLAADEGLNMPEDELLSTAERWAISKGGRSPRRARQFIDFAIAAQARNIKIEF